MSLGRLAELVPAGPGRFVGRFDASWGQGPGVYGGLAAAAVGSCLEREEPQRRLRTLSLQMCAPVTPGEVVVEVVRQRQGSAASFYTAMLKVEDKPAVIANAMLSRPRTPDLDFDHAILPAMVAPEELPDLGTAPGVPVFTHHFDFRFDHGVPFQGVEEARTGGWVRPRIAEPMSTALALGLLDVWPLSILPRMKRPRPAASVAIHFQLLHPLPKASDWYAVAVESPVCRGGYGDQLTALFTSRGELIGRCQQLVAVIR